MNKGIKILEIVDNEDGSQNWTYEVSDEMKQLFLKKYELDEFKPEQFSNFLLEVIEDFIKEKELK